MKTSDYSGFYKLSVEERRKEVAEFAGLAEEDMAILADPAAMGMDLADHMIENVVGMFALPLGIGLNFTVNGKDYLVPMVGEEASVVAAASHAAKLARPAGGFFASNTGSIMIAQVQLIDVPDPFAAKLKILEEKAFSSGERAAVRCFGADDVLEGVAIMKHEGVQVSITGNSTNPTRFQHLVAGTYKKWANENNARYFSVASGGGTGRTLHPDNMGAGPASYGLTDSMGRMHGDAQFAGSSSVPAHVEMMGLIGMGNNPMVGASVAVAVAIEQALK